MTFREKIGVLLLVASVTWRLPMRNPMFSRNPDVEWWTWFALSTVVQIFGCIFLFTRPSR